MPLKTIKYTWPKFPCGFAAFCALQAVDNNISIGNNLVNHIVLACLVIPIKTQFLISYIQGVSKKGNHLILMNIRSYKSHFTVGLRTRLHLDNCVHRI